MALMTEEQRWAFELDGYILLPSLLGAPAAAHATPAALAEHPDLLAAIGPMFAERLPEGTSRLAGAELGGIPLEELEASAVREPGMGRLWLLHKKLFR